MTTSKAVHYVYFLLTFGAIAAAQTAPGVSPPSEGATMHVLVGKSVVINVNAPLTRVLSSNPVAVETLATSPTQVVVEGKAPGESTLILWDSTGNSQILDVTVDVDIAGLRNAIQRSYPNEQLEVEADAGRLLLTGTASNPRIVEDLTKIASSYSPQVINSIQVPLVHERQVVLEVKFAEVDRSALLQLGANYFLPGNGHTTAVVNTGQFGGSSVTTSTATTTTVGNVSTTSTVATPPQVNVTNPLTVFLFRTDLNFGMAIQALQTQNVLEVLAEPNLMAISGQKASFLAGGEFPFPVVSGSTGIPTVSISFRPFGVKLDFTAFVQADNTLRLHVAPEVSTLDFADAITLSGFTVPAISTRRAETEIELKDGQSFGIAGLLDHRATTELTKIPGLGDIPILGQLFRSRSINKSNTELLVLVTPHIMDPVHADSPAAALPKAPVPFLDVNKFDKQAPGNKQATQPQDAGVK